MIWEFHTYEKEHGTKAKAYDVQINGQNRDFIFSNDPKNQRICHCQACSTKIPREVPRVKLEASYHYGAGYYCLSCGVKMLKRKRIQLENTKSVISTTIHGLSELEALSVKVMQDEWYPKKMALGKLFQVMEENQKKR